MNLNSLALFVASAQAGSLSEAARRTGIPLPTLSRRVRKLEDDLGVRLLERGPRGLGLTQAGTQLLADAAPALASLTQAKQRLYDSSGIAGTLRISVPPDFEPIWSLLSEFGSRHPAVRLDIFVTDRHVDLLADGIDVSLHVGREASGPYVGRRLARYRHLLVATPGFLEKHSASVPAEVGALPCICWRTRNGASPVWTLGGERVPLEPSLSTNDYLQLLRLCRSGQFLTELPPFLARRSIADGVLVPVLAKFPMPWREVRVLVADTRWLTPLVRRFIDSCSEALPGVLGEG